MNANSTYALVDADGRVDCVILWDGEAAWTPPPGMRAIACPAEVEAGWLFDGTAFAPPPPEGE